MASKTGGDTHLRYCARQLRLLSRRQVREKAPAAEQLPILKELAHVAALQLRHDDGEQGGNFGRLAEE